jgi:hypothetical protein
MRVHILNNGYIIFTREEGGDMCEDKTRYAAIRTGEVKAVFLTNGSRYDDIPRLEVQTKDGTSHSISFSSRLEAEQAFTLITEEGD